MRDIFVRIVDLVLWYATNQKSEQWVEPDVEKNRGEEEEEEVVVVVVEEGERL